MKIAIGADHRGYELKESLKGWLSRMGYVVSDMGTNSPEACDYPIVAEAVASMVSRRAADRGILVCKSGIGMSIAANKLPRVRAALVHGITDAELSRRHNDANVLVLSSQFMADAWEQIVRAWLGASFEHGRHARRLAQIAEIEHKYLK